MTTRVHRRPPTSCAPLVPPALAVMGGVILDRFADPWTTSTWAAIAVVAGTLAAAFGPWRTLAVAALAVAFAALGGGWHHHRWSDLAADDLSRGDWSTPRPAWVRGTLVELPEFHQGDQPGDSGLTRVMMAVSAIRDRQVWRFASGRLDVSVSGERTDLAMGDPVMAAGLLGEAAGPLNPGETDRRDHLRAQGVRLRMTVGNPMSLWPDPEGTPWPWHHRLGVLRSKSQARLIGGLDPEAAPLASALLLGRREAVDPDVNDAFARTGTTHLLAISGLHLQVLALALGLVFRTLGMRRKPALLGVAAATVAYAVLVGGMPSVVRSVAMTVAICLAGLRDRRIRAANLLAAAALATLAMNPAYLFDVGCQLSFLCIAAVFWGVPPVARRLGLGDYSELFFVDLTEANGLPPADPLKALERRYEPAWKRLGRRTWTWLALLLITSAVVWLATLPLVMLRFHLVSPIGVLLNVPLIPITSAGLLLAGLTLLTSTWGPLGGLASPACSASLKLTAWLVRWGGSCSWGHQFVAGPAWTWVVVVYGLLALAVVARSRWRRWTRGALGGWLVLGLASLMVPTRPAGLAAEVFAVGHGLSVLIQGSGGRAVLYDCGRMRDPHVGRRLIAPALWARGVRRLDLVILSHADADHYNALPDLLERFAIGEIRVPPGFDHDPSAALALNAARLRGIPVRPIVAGDRLDVGQGATLSVLHPPEDWPIDAPDNTHSIVLDLAGAGRRVLLTGDLEGEGQAALISQPPRAFDAVLAPHHGGRSANPPWFYRWAAPPLIVVSQRRPVPGSRDPLEPPPRPSARVLRTWQDGAIRFRWTETGLAAEPFVDHDADAKPKPGWIADRILHCKLDNMIIHHINQIAFSALGILLGLALCGTLAVIEWGAWTLVRPGRRLQLPTPEPPPWEPIEATADDGVRLRGVWQWAGGEASWRTVVLLHGFAEDRSALQGRAESLLAGGWNVALIDARGRGESDGDLTSFGGREADDLRAWIDALTVRVGPDLAPVLWGRSMGAAIALRAASIDPRIRALVLEAPYADLRPTVAAWLRALRIPGLLAGSLLRRAERLAGVALHRPRPIDLASEAALPVLVLHGEADPVVSPSDVRRLASAFPDPPTLIEVAEARHCNVFDVGGPALARQVLDFLNMAVPLPTAAEVRPD